MHPYNRPSPSVSDIKAKFEAKQNTSSRQPPQQPSPKAGGLADMSSSPKRGTRAHQQALQPSIDSIIDSVPANAVSPAAIRPHTSKHPSWVGPKPPGRRTPSIIAMKQPVTITFSSPGLRPPVYIGTDLTDPQWEPIEMDEEQTDRGEWTFAKSFMAEEGEYQYKLRLGPGDWWICDDSKPKVDDGAGNENNLVVVTAEPTPPTSKEPEPHPLDKVDSVTNAGPLFRHETFAPPPPVSHDDETHTDEPEDPPLLRHESIAPSSQEQNHSPLFRHESMAIDNKRHDELPHRVVGGRKASTDSIPQEADPNDPSLERFPTDHKGIMEHLDRTRNSMQADETSNEPGSPAPSQSSANSVIASVSPSLPSVREDEDGELENLREEAKAVADSEVQGTLSPDADVPTLRIIEVDVDLPERPAAPITPPDTPKEDDQDKEVVDSPMDTRVKAERLKEMISEKAAVARAQMREKAEQARRSAVPGMFLVLSFAVALASAGVAWWYFKAGGDNVVAEV